MKKGNKRIISQIGMLIVFLVGFLIMLYPFYVNALNDLIAEYTVMRYQKKEHQDFIEKKEKYQKENERIKKEGLHPGSDPFEEEQVAIKKDAELREHVIGKVNIPKLAVEMPLFDKTTPYLLEHGASVLEGTSFPVGGDSTHSVISAHRGLPDRELFTNLPKLKLNDIFLVEVLGDTLAYEVDSIETVLPEETSVLAIEPGADKMTLLTCTPYMINTHRLLVTGHRVPYTPELAKEKEQRDQWRKLKRIGIIVGVLCIVILLGSMMIKRIKAYYLSKKSMTLEIQVKHEEQIEPSRVTLYDYRGKKPVYRNGEPLVWIGHQNSHGHVKFENLPAGIYQIKVENGPKVKTGIKSSKQNMPMFYLKRQSVFELKKDGWELIILNQNKV
ncbi:class C sortase [Vagococcus lutrae]|uniref:class C sortase n=1 Tax=Vagococcus lutrae TaxID=81947 RepID=UPI0023A9DAEA|nr:class C sortase [Vagococcus lutrae]WEB81147.1 class C sortase [Vagococcus lutrae]